MGEKVRILFIVPTHENNECLLDTVQNIKNYNPDVHCLIAIQVNRHFKDFSDGMFSILEDVLIQKDDSNTSGYKYESQFEPLIKTYAKAKRHFQNFEYVVIFHTSQLFVREGFYNYIKDYDTSFDERSDQLPNRYHAIFDMKLFENLMEDYRNLANYFYQGIELAFYKKEVFDFIESESKKFPLSVSQINNYFTHTPIEEVIIPTLAVMKSNKIGRNVIKWLNDPMEDYKLEDSHFSIKSIPRDINHPVRMKFRK